MKYEGHCLSADRRIYAKFCTAEWHQFVHGLDDRSIAVVYRFDNSVCACSGARRTTTTARDFLVVRTLNYRVEM